MLGRGSFGQVVRAFDHKSRRWVALKIVRSEERFRRQALDEIHMLSLLARADPDRRSHVVRMLDHFEFRRHPCIVFEPLGVIITILIILLALTSSSQLPLKLPGHGTRWLLNWFKRLADRSHLSPRTAERQYFCSSACPLPFNGEMRSPSSTRSLPPINYPLQSFLA